MTSYTGNGAYCFTNSLHMCLRQAGLSPVPEVSLLECMTGMPFGATFIDQEPPLFFPSPGGATSPDQGLTRALETIGWTCDLLRFAETDRALGALRDAVRTGPALIGPLDMGYLPYDPLHAYKRGADHFVVALGIRGELVQVHDPQSYPFAVLPIADLVRAWDARHIGYAVAAYTLRCAFRTERSVARPAMLEATLATAQHMVAAPPAGPVMHGGADGFARAAAVLRGGPPETFTRLLGGFALPLGARRCLDAAGFLDEVGRPRAARLMVDKAEAFGRAQYRVAQGDWKRTADVFDELARTEAAFAAALGDRHE